LVNALPLVLGCNQLTSQMVFVVVLLYGTQGIGMALNKQYAQVLEHKPILRQVVRKAEEEARLELHANQAAEEPIVLDKNAESAWKRKAELRWGQRINLANPRSWETYVKSRMPVTVPRSPSGLLQESYADCPWRLLITCCLMSRVSSAETKMRCIEGFFSAFPTPR
jgi:heme exporter protein D